jgi:hypothetical protein
LTTRGHTRTSRRSSHASGAFTPLLAGVERRRLRGPGWRHHHAGLRAACPLRAAFRWRDPLARGREPAGRRARAKDCGCPCGRDRSLLVTRRAPGSPEERFARPGGPCGAFIRPRLTSDASRERDTVGKSRGAFVRVGTRTMVGDRSSTYARTAPPSRRLRGGLAQAKARLRLPRWAPSSDEGERPPWVVASLPAGYRTRRGCRAAAPVTTSTIESARGQDRRKSCSGNPGT